MPKTPLKWVSNTARAEVRSLPADVKIDVGTALRAAQYGGRSENAFPLQGYEIDVYEIVIDEGGETYRTIYVAAYEGAVWVLGAFHKKSTKGAKVPKHIREKIGERIAALKRKATP